jgi:O-antigen/teichoic acid export membrane protein
LGSYLVVKVFKLSIKTAVGVAVFAATIGAFVALLYVRKKIKDSKNDLNVKAKALPEERKITDKKLYKKIILYALPFVIISVLQSGFTMVDVFTVVKSLSSIGYTTAISENVVSVIATWGSKLNMIVMSLANGIIMSLIPAIAGAYAVKNYKEVNANVNKAFQTLILFTIPLSVGMSFMSSSVWTVFYGYDALNISLFSLLILSQIPLSIFSVMLNTNQTINNTKATISALVVSVFLKICLNVPFMHLFNNLGIEAYYAPIGLNIIIDTIAVLYLMISVKKKTGISYLKSVRALIKTILSVLIMVVTLSILNLFIPIGSTSRIGAMLEIIIYGLVGVIVYFIVTYKSKLLSEVLGDNIVNKIIGKIKRLVPLKK